ncbi:hypothetical protein CYMTET_29275 [Cymbomonas tetramitiformis]|uniref:E3 ubiquitin-protein ligase listerin n=1 Tax=Cymbomonas tetramitiformis TaxID=36881 RepID=A0AAE0FLD0_9CHLO|nr:hypothetical protein CYMTET_29275 [Cymbomonas tetramitiformis]
MGRDKNQGSSRGKNVASSSRAADTLQATGASSSAFVVGFGGFSGSHAIEPTAFGSATPASSMNASAGLEGNAEASLAGLDGEAALHLKRLSKRDPVTKIKALQALQKLIQERQPVEVETLILPWAQVFSRVAMDNSRQVREAGMAVMGALAKTVKKALAPHLKALMGPWYAAQFDPCSEVAAAAGLSFEAAFPPAKQRDALKFCQAEIVARVEEVLTVQPQFLSDKSATPEEASERHERVVSSALLSLIELLKLQDAGSTTGGSTQEAIWGLTRAMVQAKNFWKGRLAAKTSLVRRAGYMLMQVICKQAPELIQEEVPELAPLVLGAFSDKEPEGHAALWDMVLMFTRAFPASWGSANLHKVSARSRRHGAPPTSTR